MIKFLLELRLDVYLSWSSIIDEWSMKIVVFSTPRLQVGEKSREIAKAKEKTAVKTKQNMMDWYGLPVYVKG